MTPEQQEGNKAINIFRGLALGKKGYVNDYHTNWNNLMLVVEKIENVENGLHVVVTTRHVAIWFIEGRKDFTSITFEYPDHPEKKIEYLWQAVVQFIQWYNETQSQLK